MEKLIETSQGKVYTKITGKLNDDKDVLVFISGINGTAAFYDPITSYLKDQYTIVALDLLGQGQSAEAKDGKYNTDVEAWAMLEAVAGLMITKPLIIFGYGVGGLIAVNMAELRPFGIGKVILLNTPATDKYAEMDANSRLAAIPLLGKLANSPVKPDLYFAKDFDRTTLLDSKIVEESAKSVDRSVAKQLSKMAYDYLSEHPLNRRLRTVSLPALAIFSDQDQILKLAGVKDAKATIGRVPDLTMVDLSGVGHVAMLERPELIAKEIVKFDQATPAKEEQD